MYIYLTEDNHISGCGSEYEEGAVDFKEEMPTEVWNDLGYYYYINGQFILDQELKELIENRMALRREAEEIEAWFNWYDQQVAQYNRSLRTGQEYDNDIDELDQLAIEKQERIRQIREVLG